MNNKTKSTSISKKNGTIANKANIVNTELIVENNQPIIKKTTNIGSINNSLEDDLNELQYKDIQENIKEPEINPKPFINNLLPWSEKYRPSSIKNIISQKLKIKSFK